MKTSVVMTTFCRPEYLDWCLETLWKQNLMGLDYEILVLNDGVKHDGTYEVVRKYACLEMNIRYLFTGQRNADCLHWRVMGFSANVGIKEADGEIVVLTNSDIYHWGETLLPVVNKARVFPMALGTVSKIHDDDGSVVRRLREDLSINEAIAGLQDSFPHPQPEMPFFLAVRREHLLNVGGYDEDFTGYACDDADLMGRLLKIGCHYEYVDAEVVHLFHGRRDPEKIAADQDYQYNLSLLNERSDQIVRNVGKEWGVA